MEQALVGAAATLAAFAVLVSLPRHRPLQTHPQTSATPGTTFHPAVSIARLRLARGEITTSQYRRLLEALHVR